MNFVFFESLKSGGDRIVPHVQPRTRIPKARMWVRILTAAGLRAVLLCASALVASKAPLRLAWVPMIIRSLGVNLVLLWANPSACLPVGLAPLAL